MTLILILIELIVNDYHTMNNKYINNKNINIKNINIKILVAKDEERVLCYVKLYSVNLFCIVFCIDYVYV